MFIDDLRQAKICRNTRVLFHIKGTEEYLMTNDPGDELELLRVFSADKDGKIYMEGYLLGSIFAHDPYIIPDLEDVNCTFESLNSKYFNARPVTDGLIGLSVGDAFGVPYEFLSRAEIAGLDIGEMVGCDSELSFSSRWGDMIPADGLTVGDSFTLTVSVRDSEGRFSNPPVSTVFQNVAVDPKT